MSSLYLYYCVFILGYFSTKAQESMTLTSSCCTLATGSCRATCEEISLVDLATSNDDRWRYISKLSSFCSEQLVPFWSCMNETLTEIDKGQGFFGRPCCTLPQSQACIMVCLQAKDRDELISACRPSNEITFYSCLERQEDLHCCDRSSNADCRLACRNILRTQTIGQEIVDNLIDGGCGYPMPHDKLWQCFLTNADSNKPEPKSVSRLDNLGMDSAKLQCCFRAATMTCQRLCIKTYSNEWEETWGDFDRQCQYQLAESPMLRCLAEVEEPCELGCEGLSYCTNFNHRPTELFRNCDSRTDQAAKHDVDLWHQGIIRMPTVDIPVLDIATCYPDTWKTIACALQIKPCQSKAHANMICRSDCIKILSNCVDRSRLLEGQSPSTLCDVLSPPGITSPCISLAPFLSESKYMHTAVMSPIHAKIAPALQNEVCHSEQKLQLLHLCSKFILKMQYYGGYAIRTLIEAITPKTEQVKKCVPRRQVCLSLKKKCSQYICVNKDNCEDKPYSPVCDTENDEHPNACLLLEKKRTLAYFGKCLTTCQRKGQVCGHDGREYSSECAALAEKMSIDYRGPCIRRRPTEEDKTGCSAVSCQPLPSESCNGIVPPNSCCPICGVAIKLVYSQRMLDQVVEAIQSMEPATISKVAQKLQEHIKTAECDISTYLDEDFTIVALIFPNIPRPSSLQIEACYQEAMKLQSLVEQRSPTLVTEIPLSALTGSYLVQPMSNSSSSGSVIFIDTFLQIVIVLVVMRKLMAGNIT
ncbi:reversion-inducing cysteine-rich protein with Kazal motifs [Nephila pilipes]|uniref:Reversion-inducing cysteine-rich protein with Kazal motifs n=1 Tax=Nephila pilipes TaxID=299642 RepID=A0A8X6NXA8_NEPPI|nr:reversion-inducing cysteine-rich protein with Kazal motifs [Nephila pilipes]